MKMQMNKTKYVSVVLIIIILILIGVSVWYFVQINRGLKLVMAEKTFLAMNKNVEELGSIIDQQKGHYTEVKQRIDSLYIDKNKIVDFIETLEKIAQENAVTVTITGVDQQEGVGEGLVEYGTLSMFVNAYGKFNDVKRFLGAVEKLPYAIFVTNTKLVKNVVSRDNPERVWSINFTLEVITN